jgi:hypothetical protein
LAGQKRRAQTRVQKRSQLELSATVITMVKMKVTSFHVVTISIFKALYHQYGIISYNHE